MPFTYRSNSYIKSIKKYLHSDCFLHNLFISFSNEIHSIIFKTIIKFKLYRIHIWSFHSNSPHFSYKHRARISGEWPNRFHELAGNFWPLLPMPWMQNNTHCQIKTLHNLPQMCRKIRPSLSMDKQLRGYQKSQHIFHLLNLLNCYIIHLYLLKHSFNDWIF